MFFSLDVLLCCDTLSTVTITDTSSINKHITFQHNKWLTVFNSERYIITTVDNKTLIGKIIIRNEGVSIQEVDYLTSHGKRQRVIKWENIKDIQIAKENNSKKRAYIIYLGAIAAVCLYISAIEN